MFFCRIRWFWWLPGNTKNTKVRSRMRALDQARDGMTIVHLNDRESSLNIFSLFYHFYMGPVMDINNNILKHLICSVTIENIAVNMRGIWRHPVLSQSKRSPHWKGKATHLSVCVATARSGRGHSVARQALTLLNAPHLYNTRLSVEYFALYGSRNLENES